MLLKQQLRNHSSDIFTVADSPDNNKHYFTRPAVSEWDKPVSNNM